MSELLKEAEGFWFEEEDHLEDKLPKTPEDEGVITFEEEGFPYDEPSESFEVSESEPEQKQLEPGTLFDLPDSEIVEDEEDPNSIPGSKIKYEPEPEQQAKDTDWAKDHDPAKFCDYAKDKLKKIPKHSGETVPGCERAKAFLKSLLNEISQAMRTDLEGKIDETVIDCLRKSIDDMIDRLDKQINKLKGTSKKKNAELNVKLYSQEKCSKCEAETPMWHDIKNGKLVCLSCEAEEKTEDGLVKEATTPVMNLFVTAFQRACVSMIINSVVSAGRDINESYEIVKGKFNFSPREELEMKQLLADYGYPVYFDRGRINEGSNPSDNTGLDWAAQYPA